MKILTLLFFIAIWLSCSAQNTKYELSSDIIVQTSEKIIETDSNSFTLVICEIKNSGTDTFLMWFSEKDITNLPQDEIIKDHFFVTKGDFNLFQLATETITETTRLPEHTFSFFTALIEPNSIFRYSILVKGQISETFRNSCDILLKNQLIILSQKELKKYFEITTLDRILVKTGQNIIDWNVIKDEILEQ